MKLQNFLLWIIALGVSVSIALHFVDIPGNLGSQESQGDTNIESLRDYAAQLKANQLYAKSAEGYDEYILRCDLSDSEKAKIDFNTGNMLLDNVGDFEGALAHFLRVTGMYEGVDAKLVKEARKLSAECMEKLNRSGAAERELVAASRLKVEGATEEEESVEESQILAKIGERVAITRTDFDELWAQIPEYARDSQFPEPDGKKKFLKEMISTELFAGAARRKGYDREPEVRRQIKTIEDSILASRLMQAEVHEKVSLDRSDLELFFEAHKDHYKEPAAVEVAHILVSDATGAAVAGGCIEAGSSFAEAVALFSEDDRTKDQEGNLGRIQLGRPPLDKKEPFDPLDVAIPGFGKSPELVQAAFALNEVGDVTGPIKTDHGYHLISLLSKTEEEEKPFEEVIQRVGGEMQQERVELQKDQLVEELIRTNRVRLYADRLED